MNSVFFIYPEDWSSRIVWTVCIVLPKI